jgi:hypothetical protein
VLRHWECDLSVASPQEIADQCVEEMKAIVAKIGSGSATILDSDTRLADLGTRAVGVDPAVVPFVQKVYSWALRQSVLDIANSRGAAVQAGWDRVLPALKQAAGE